MILALPFKQTFSIVFPSHVMSRGAHLVQVSQVAIVLMEVIMAVYSFR